MPPAAVMVLSLVLLLMVALADFSTSPDFSFSLFYILPLALATRFAGRNYGFAIAMLSVLPLLYEGIANGHLALHPVKYLWNVSLHIATLALISAMMHRMHVHLERETQLARTDSLTGVLNRRAFRARLATVADDRRLGGEMIALAYVDLDDFKYINELGGHQLGDDVLRIMARALSSSVRDTDIVGRLGGDEFALILRGVSSQQATVVLNKIKSRLARDASARKVSITCSIGCVMFRAAAHDIEAIIHVADELMFDVKRAGKNGMLLKDLGHQVLRAEGTAG